MSVYSATSPPLLAPSVRKSDLAALLCLFPRFPETNLTVGMRTCMRAHMHLDAIAFMPRM